jgi:hypothetical protein
MEDHNKQLTKKERGTSTSISASRSSDSSDTDSSRSTPSSGSDVALLMSLARTAYQTKYMDLWWQLYLPNGQRLSKVVASNAMGGWLDAVHEMNFREPVLEKALVAMSVTAVGKQEGDPFLKEEGRRLYGKALQSMTVAMKDPRRATSDGILTAVRLFSFYEVGLLDFWEFDYSNPGDSLCSAKARIQRSRQSAGRYTMLATLRLLRLDLHTLSSRAIHTSFSATGEHTL